MAALDTALAALALHSQDSQPADDPASARFEGFITLLLAACLKDKERLALSSTCK